MITCSGLRDDVSPGVSEVVLDHLAYCRAPRHDEERVEGCSQDGTEDEVDVEPGDTLGRYHRGEDASCCNKVREIHQEDSDSTLSFFRDESGVFQSFSCTVELANSES